MNFIELNKPKSSERVILAFKGCGFHALESETTITFTTCGYFRELLTIRRTLKTFMNKYGAEIDGKLVYEATAFWSLHGIGPDTLAQIADRVMVLQ